MLTISKKNSHTLFYTLMSLGENWKVIYHMKDFSHVKRGKWGKIVVIHQLGVCWSMKRQKTKKTFLSISSLLCWLFVVSECDAFSRKKVLHLKVAHMRKVFQYKRAWWRNTCEGWIRVSMVLVLMDFSNLLL